MTGQDAVKLGEAFGSAVGLEGVILTKLDGDARGGAALSLRVATGQRVRFAGTGERPQDLEVFQADRIASRILGMGDVLTLIEKAEGSLDKQTAAEVEKRLRAGQLSFDDFLLQIRQLRSMGSLEGLLDMLPGGGALKAQVAGADTEKEVRRMEAIILSMTAKERSHLGYYDPMTDPVKVKIDVDKVVKWLQQGAQPSEAARSLLKREGILERLAETRKSTASA